MGVRIVVCVSARVSGYIVPYSALPLDPSVCVLTPRESPPPPHQLLYCVEYLY